MYVDFVWFWVGVPGLRGKPRSAKPLGNQEEEEVVSGKKRRRSPPPVKMKRVRVAESSFSVGPFMKTKPPRENVAVNIFVHGRDMLYLKHNAGINMVMYKFLLNEFGAEKEKSYLSGKEC